MQCNLSFQLIRPRQSVYNNEIVTLTVWSLQAEFHCTWIEGIQTASYYKLHPKKCTHKRTGKKKKEIASAVDGYTMYKYYLINQIRWLHPSIYKITTWILKHFTSLQNIVSRALRFIVYIHVTNTKYINFAPVIFSTRGNNGFTQS